MLQNIDSFYSLLWQLTGEGPSIGVTVGFLHIVHIVYIETKE